jgi:hypothetical protein
MIGVLGNLGRVVGREMIEETVGRLIAGQTAEDIFTREEVARRIGQKSFDLLVDKIKKEMKRREDERIENDKKKEIDWNARMNDFARNLNQHYRQHTTLYKEERNIGNKEKVEDRFGLSNAYASPSGLYKTGKTLYISGTTGKDGSITRDIIDDLIHLPTRNAEHTEKYKDVIEELKKSPEIKRIVGHSLGSAVVNTINQNHPNKYQTTTYATPAVKPKRKGKQDPRHRDYRNPNDPVSALDGYAITSDLNEPNPLSAHGFKNFAGNGLWHIRPTTAISNGFNPNSPVQS